MEANGIPGIGFACQVETVGEGGIGGVAGAVRIASCATTFSDGAFAVVEGVDFARLIQRRCATAPLMTIKDAAARVRINEYLARLRVPRPEVAMVFAAC